jgi:hypothetical protein
MRQTLKKRGLNNLKDVYALLGVSWQTVYKWRYNAATTQSRGYFKHSLIKKAGELFSLGHAETENLANKAGLSVCGNSWLPRLEIMDKLNGEFSEEIAIYADEILKYKTLEPVNSDFVEHFSNLLASYPDKKIDLCDAALVSDRMFRHIKSGRFLRKEPLLALLIVMNLNWDDIQKALEKAGFTLSHSVHFDVVTMWMLKNELHNHKGAKRLYRINELLDSLKLPLLMTRCRD